MIVLCALLLSASASAARTTRAAVLVYPSGTSFGAGTPLPPHPGAGASLAMPVGGVDDATVLVRGAHTVAVPAAAIAAPLQLRLFFAHYVSVDGTPVPDALLPWDGSPRPTEHVNQPVWLQVTVPYGTPPGTYAGSVQVVADGRAAEVPVSVSVAPVSLPQPNQVTGSLLTAFNLSPQSYAAKANALYGVSPQAALPGLFRFVASYRLSPNNWGYGNPDSPHGYTTSRSWWLDKAAQMVAAVGARQFAAMWIPVSNNRWAPRTYVGGLSPFAPRTWCGYLRSVRRFWQAHGWLDSYPYLWGMDEPGLPRFRIVAQQAAVAHACFPGSHVLVTGNPSAQNRFLWNGGRDDVDAWVVLASRFYGTYTTPSQRRRGLTRATSKLRAIDAVRRRGAQIWTYTYDAPSHSTPGFTATEPLADPRLLVDWAALEGITGLLYGQGTTTYGRGDPLASNDREAGSYVLIYPGRNGPIASARLEVLREGIEDWEILNLVRRKRGDAAVRRILSGLFSTTATATELGCTVGCQLRTTTKYAWPLWSHDASTPGKLAAMRAAALRAAS